MADLQPTDQFLVNRSDSTQTVEHADLMAELQNTDLLLVNRSDVTHTITGEDFKNSVLDPLAITKPVLDNTSPKVDDVITVIAVGTGGKSPLTYTYQWKKTGGIDIAGATNSIYTVLEADVGETLACEVTVTDDLAQTATDISDYTAAVQNNATVNQPSIVAPADNAGEMVQAETDEITGFIEGPSRPWDLSVIASTGYVLSNNDTTLTRQNGSISFVSLDGVTIGPSETKTFTFSHTNLSNDPAPIYTTVVNKDPSDSADRGGYIDTKTEGWAIRIQDNAVLFYKAEELQRIDATPYNPTNGATNEFMFEISRDGTYQIWKFKNQTTGYTASYTFNDTHAGDVYMAFTSNNYDQTVTSGPGDSVLTLAGNKDLDILQPLDDVQQDSGYTAETSEITGVTEVFESNWNQTVDWVGTGTIAGTPYNSDYTWDKFFDGTLSGLGPQAQPNTGEYTLTLADVITDVTQLSFFSDSDQALSASFTINGIAINSANCTRTGSAAPYEYQVASSFTTIESFGNGGSFNPQGVKVNGKLLVTPGVPGADVLEQTILTLTDATDLDVFEQGDVITGYTQTDISVTGQTTGTNTIDKFITAWNSSGGSGNFFLDTTIPGNYVEFGVPSAGTLILKGGRTSLIDVDITATGDFTGGDRDFVWTGGDTSQTFQFTGAGVVRLTVTNSSNGIYVNGVDSTFNGSTFSLGTPVTVVSVKDPDLGAPYQMTVDGGDWTENDGQAVTCTYEPATGTVGSTGDKTITLSASDETFPKRWIAGKGKFVKGEETPSQDAAPEVDGLELQSTEFASTPAGVIAHTSSDWQITLKTDTSYSSPVSESFDNTTDLIRWEPTSLETETAYRCRVRHNSNTTQSSWSVDSTFKTAKSNDFNVKPGPVWQVGTPNDAYNMGPGVDISLPEAMAAVGWGDWVMGVGASGKLYLSSSGSFADLAEISALSANTYMGAGGMYSNTAYIALRDDDVTMDILGTSGVYQTTLKLPGDNQVHSLGWDPRATSQGIFYVLGENGVLYAANGYKEQVTAFTDISGGQFTDNIRQFAIPNVEASYWGKNSIFVITDDDTLWEADLVVRTTGSVITGKTEYTPGSKYKTVTTSYDGAIYAVTTDNNFVQINAGDAINPPATFPDGFTAKEIACGYSDLFVLGTDGSIIYVHRSDGTDNTGNTPPSSPGVWGVMSTMPRPCPGFTTAKWSGSGYAYGFIIPN